MVFSSTPAEWYYEREGTDSMSTINTVGLACYCTPEQVALIGDAFLSCGCLSYYGPFTGAYRDDLVAFWTEKVREEGIPCSGAEGSSNNSGFSLIDTLGDPVEIRGWQNCALPTDKVRNLRARHTPSGYRGDVA